MRFKGQVVVPWSLDAEIFRFLIWKEDSKPDFDWDDASEFWEAALAEEDPTIGLLSTCLLDKKGCFTKGCQLVSADNYSMLPEKASELDEYTFEELLKQAKESPPSADEPMYETHGYDGLWSVWYGWRYPHRWVGDVMVRRYHLFGCPLRNVCHSCTLINPIIPSPMMSLQPSMLQVPMGQLRSVSSEKEPLEAQYEPVVLRKRSHSAPSPAPPKRVRRKPNPKPPIEVAPLSEYELKRSKNMAENDEVLRSLGLID